MPSKIFVLSFNGVCYFVDFDCLCLYVTNEDYFFLSCAAIVLFQFS